jgi:predicted DNA-binding transcriptional regulator AlpA
MTSQLTANIPETPWDKQTAEPLWDKKQTAKYLGISVKSLDRWIATGSGPRARKVGVQVRYVPADVRAFVDSCQALGGKLEITAA